jgi:hypothetical protein
MDYFVEAARRAPEGMLFVAVGSGVQKKALCEKAENLKLRNLLVLRAAPRSGVPELLALADCLYIGARKSRLYAYGIGMNKLWEYMYAGRPILFAVDCADNPVAEAGCGVTVSPEDPDAIVRKQLPEAGKSLYSICGGVRTMKKWGGSNGNTNIGTQKKTFFRALGVWLSDTIGRKSFSVRLGPGAGELYPLMSRKDIRYVAQEICRTAARNAK